MPREGLDLWVFAYGSLIWRPGFEFQERHPAIVRGYHRSLCVYSFVHRGTPESPGLVLGLMRGGACKGVAYRIAASHSAETIAYLRDRELVTDVYKEATLNVWLHTGEVVPAIAYVVDTHHRQFAGQLDRDERLRLVQYAIGRSGPNSQYVTSTHEHMLRLGIRDHELEWLATRLGFDGGPMRACYS